MVGNLDDSIKIPFIMHYKGYKYQEIADELDLPLGTIKSRIFFARKELKDVINARYNIAIDPCLGKELKILTSFGFRRLSFNKPELSKGCLTTSIS